MVDLIRDVISPDTARRLALRAVVSGVAAGCVWVVVGAVLAPSAALDLTDEGLYLLSADPADRSSGWGFPAGWHLAPLFAAVGYDIAAFRSAGATILVLASAWLGWQVSSYRRRTDDPRPQRSAGGLRTTRLVPWLGSLAVGAASLLFYASFLRTPSYNWLNLVGLVVTAAAFVGVSRTTETGSRWWPAASEHLLIALAALGLFASVPAKPSSAPLAYVLGVALVAAVAGWASARRVAAWVVVWCAGLLAAALITGLWPWSFVTIFVRRLRAPTLDETQSLGGALQDVRGLPLEAIEALFSLSAVAMVLVLAAIMLMVASAFIERGRSVLHVGGLALVALAVLHRGDMPLPFVTADGRNGTFTSANLTTATLVLLVGGVVFTVAGRVASGDGTAPHQRLAIATALYVAAMAFVFGFGSSNETYRMASVAAVLLFAGAIALVTSHPSQVSAAIGALLVATVVAIFVTVTLADAHASPYRSGPISEQTVPTAVGPHGAELMLDDELAGRLSRLGEQAAAAGWQPGTPLIGLLWRWSSTLPYHLGAHVPGSLMITIFGYGEGSVTVAEQTLRRLEPSDWQDAWLLTTDHAALDEEAAAELRAVTDLLPQTVELRFPDDFECMVAVGEWQLWAPAHLSRQDGPTC